MPGGGGWGDPLDRDPTSVLNDVRNEYISVEGANRDYGVVIDTLTWNIELEATQNLRESRRRLRGEAIPPIVTWEEK